MSKPFLDEHKRLHHEGEKTLMHVLIPWLSLFRRGLGEFSLLNPSFNLAAVIRRDLEADLKQGKFRSHQDDHAPQMMGLYPSPLRFVDRGFQLLPRAANC